MTSKKKFKLSVISALHYYKLIFRSVFFIAALVIYIVGKLKNSENSFGGLEDSPVVLSVIGIVFLVEMLLRFFPSRVESMGCQKQFPRNYSPTEHTDKPKRFDKSVLFVALFWVALNGVIAALYYLEVIDAGILVLISLAYSVCDMICILFFCPFQTWFMKNKCCGSCRIYNWDYAMMFTPLVFVPNILARGLFAVAFILLLVWEITAFLHPERFSPATNDCLSCANCKEKLCHHKRQLRHFLRKNKHLLILKCNAIIEKAKKKISKK